MTFPKYTCWADIRCSQDLLLNEISARANLIVLSVDYPLAPEHPYPQPRVHCCLVVEWLLANCEAKVSNDFLYGITRESELIFLVGMQSQVHRWRGTFNPISIIAH